MPTEDDDVLPKSKWKNVVSRHRLEKRVTSGVGTAASIGVTAASLATGTSTIAVAGAVIAGAAVSATGIGLVAAGAALTVGSMAASARSAYKTSKHLKRLEEIYSNRGLYRRTCQLLPWGDNGGLGQEFGILHVTVAEVVLPWIIHQKKHKLGKKVGSAAGGGLLVGVWGAGRNLYKRAKGTLGKKRTYYAECLAVHLITCNCKMAEDIVSELYSPQEMRKLSVMDSETAAPLIADKMKSV